MDEERDIALIDRPEHLEQPEMSEKPIHLMAKQDKFIFSEKQFCGYGGGVGNGKSMSGIIKVFNHCMEQPGAFFLIGRRHATDLRNSTLKDFLQMMRGYGRWMEQAKTFKFPNGSEVVFSHLDDLQSLTNMNLSGFWIDQAEECPEEAFDYLIGRCRRQKGLTGGMITSRPKMITFNPNGHDWIWRRFHEHIDLDGKVLGNVEDYELVMATTLENRENLPEDYLKSILANPEEWRKRFVDGSFDTKAGRIFDDFNKQIHVIPYAKQFAIPPEWIKIRSIDHGQTNPTACLWGAIDFDQNIWVYQEYYKPKGTVSEHVRNILDRSQSMGPQGMEPDKYSYTVIDPSTHMKNREKDGYRYSVADEYMDAGIPTINGQNSVEAGIARVREYLKVDPERWHPLATNHLGEAVKGSPKVFIFEACEWLIKELPEYQWKPLNYKQIGMANNPEQPVKSFDHAVDAFRYMIMSRPVEPQHLSQIDHNIWKDPIQLQMYARRNGLTVDDLVAQRFRTEGHIRHREGGIPVREGL